MRVKVANYFFEKNIDRIKSQKKYEGIDFQKYIMYGVLAMILIVATISMAVADESILTQSFSNSELDNDLSITPRGHIEDFSWTKRVSIDGVIEISGIGFSVVNDDVVSRSFEICTIIQGPLGKFTPPLGNPLACTNTEEIEVGKKSVNHFIDFSNGVKVSELVDISIAIQEL